jgi:hypothetical protein
MRIEHLELSNKKVYLAPFNNLTQSLYIDLLQQSADFLGFVDAFASGDNIIAPSDIGEYDIALIVSPNYYKEISKHFANEKSYVLIPYKGSFFFYKPDTLLLSWLMFWYPMYYQQSWRMRLQWFYFRTTLATKYRIFLHNNERQLKQLQHKHTKQRMFMIGNGPSLTMNDLMTLHTHHELSFASNKIFLAFDEIAWRPTYYTAVDPLDIKEYYTTINDLSGTTKILPLNYLKDYPALQNTLHFNLLNPLTFDEISFSKNLLYGIYSGESVIHVMLQIAAAMGCHELYLLGMDHNYVIPKQHENDLYIADEGVQNHFHKNYRSVGDKWTEPRLDNATIQFERFDRLAKEQGVTIYNATRGGKLEAFERVEFDTLFPNKENKLP